MDLVLWRHAEAEEGMDDLARPLTARGRRQAARMADWLRRHVPAPWTVQVSPAQRTRETAEALHMPFEVVSGLQPGASAREVLELIGWPDRSGSLIVVGHQPTLGRLASMLLTGQEAEWSVRKGAVVWLNSRDREGLSPIQLRASLSPDLLTHA